MEEIMQNLHRRFTLAVLIGLCLTGLVIADKDKDKDDKDKDKKGAYVETDLVVNQRVGTVPTLTDANGIVHIAKFFDPHLVNPWGISESQGSPFWVSDNGAGVSTLYNTEGMPQGLVVSIPAPGDPLGNKGKPTGTVFNIAPAASTGFMISGVNASGAPAIGRAVFLFATEDGTIVGWNPGINPAGFDPAKAGTYGIIAVTTPDAVYKGLAIATDATGATHLYATNFSAGRVDVFDTSFMLMDSPGAFVDRKLPDRYAPFNIAVITGRLFVTYAVRGATGDDVKGEGHGIIDTFDLDGGSGDRFAQHGQLNSPWGMALTPDDFGDLGGTLWVGNFGNGHIDAYELKGGKFVGKVRNSDGQALVIDGLWALQFGNGGNGGKLNTLYFTAGPNDENDGLFGSISPGDNGKK